MQKHTRIAFNGYMANQAKINEVESAAVTFNVAPTPAQKLEKAIQESNRFLTKINIIPVDEPEAREQIVAVRIRRVLGAHFMKCEGNCPGHFRLVETRARAVAFDHHASFARDGTIQQLRTFAKRRKFTGG